MRKTMAALVLSALVLVLSGCVFTKPEASLYRLPKLSGEFQAARSMPRPPLAAICKACR